MKNSRRDLPKDRVRISDDFRDNLIIDRYHPVFVRMRASKRKHLRSENSEDAVTWNVFMSLRQIDPAAWLPALCASASPAVGSLLPDGVSVSLWAPASPPTSLLAEGDEGVSEVDVLIEAPTWVWCIEAKYRSDISTGTTTRPFRDQLLRNIDVGSYYAGVRDFHFSALISSEKASPVGVKTFQRYGDLDTPRRELAKHRPDGLSNLRTISLLTWEKMGAVLMEAEEKAKRRDESAFARRALDWLRSKGLAPTPSSP